MLDSDGVSWGVGVIVWEVRPFDKAVIVVFHGIADASEGESARIVNPIEVSMK